MLSRCATCGFRSDAPDFFRREKGGALGRLQPVCQGCAPYRPTPPERRILRSVVVSQALWLIGLAWVWKVGTLKEPAPAFLMIEALLLSSPLLVIVHEAGHALVGVALGVRLLRLRIGFGPAWRMFRLAGVLVEVRRYAFASGLTQFAGLKGRARMLAVFGAGAGANALAAALIFAAGYRLDQVGWGRAADFGPPILAGIGLAQALGLLNLLSFRSLIDGLPSDGRQILAVLSAKSSATDPWSQLTSRGMVDMDEGRFAEAAEIFIEATRVKPDSPLSFSMVLHALQQNGGEANALAYFRAHRAAIETAIEAPDEAHRVGIATLHANIAWVALKAAPQQERDLIERHSGAAMAEAPEAMECLGRRGAHLLQIGQADAGRSLLIRAIRLTPPGLDRSAFAALLAEAERARGDTRTAEAFEGLSRHALASAP